MMKKLGNEVTDVEIKDIITESGSSKASGITYAEFQKLMGMGIKNLREPEDPEDELRHAFRLFDQDGDGAWRPNPDPYLRPPPRRAAASGSPLPVRLLRLRPRPAAPWTRATATARPVAPPPAVQLSALMPCRRIHLRQGAQQGSRQLRPPPSDRQGGGAGHSGGDTQRRPQDQLRCVQARHDGALRTHAAPSCRLCGVHPVISW